MTNQGERRGDVDRSRLLEAMAHFPDVSRGFVAYLSNIFLEGDVYKSHRDDPETVRDIAGVLRSQGLAGGDIRLVLNYFEFKPADIEEAVKEKNGS